jgi:hypothetical protein
METQQESGQALHDSFGLLERVPFAEVLAQAESMTGG